MDANQTNIQKILGNVQQYVVPQFQRPYSWKSRQWDNLWKDLREMCEDPQPRHHFIGSIVTLPSKSVPEGVSKYVLIDGQQRLTTILILLAALRDVARHEGDGKLADRVDDLLLKNRHQDGWDVYKLLPTQIQSDRTIFCALMDGQPVAGKDGVAGAYAAFVKKLRTRGTMNLEKLHTVIGKHLVLVSIVLDRDDNPHLIFESLNATGQPLSQSDLIRNFFFMRIHADEQDRVYAATWRPMEERLGPHMEEFFRHSLMREGRMVRKADVYFTMKEWIERLSGTDVEAMMRGLAADAIRYEHLIRPDSETDIELRSRLVRLNRFEATTAYPFLLNLYGDRVNGKLTTPDFGRILDALEAFLIRRNVCGLPTHVHTRLFASLYAQAATAPTLLEGVHASLAGKHFPGDGLFRERFATTPLYGDGEKRQRAKLILDRLESSFAHKEPINLTALTIEHVMPQTLSEDWKSALGMTWADDHKTWIDTVGNLTLTGYNTPLHNYAFAKKKEILATAHVELTKSIVTADVWNAAAIQLRGHQLADRALAIWPDFTPPTAVPDETEDADESEDDAITRSADVLRALGGTATKVPGTRYRIHALPDGRIVNLKYSRQHPKYYWYGIHRSLWDEILRMQATHLVMIMGSNAYACLPLDVVAEYLKNAETSNNVDGTIRHFHVRISLGETPELFHYGPLKRQPIRRYVTWDNEAEGLE